MGLEHPFIPSLHSFHPVQDHGEELGGWSLSQLSSGNHGQVGIPSQRLMGQTTLQVNTHTNPALPNSFSFSASGGQIMTDPAP